MRVLFLSLLLLPLGLRPLTAQGAAALAGTVRGPYGAVEGARVQAGPAVATSDRDGWYRLALPPGRHRVRIAAIGHAPAERTVELAAGASVRLDVVLGARAAELEPIVVTGTLREVSVRESPVKVDVVTERFLRRELTQNLMDAVGRLTGVAQQVDCGVCFTNGIRINGMEGPYTAVLIDGSPVMSSLATVYGLNGINPAIVEQVEIIRGPASTLYGSEAMGGVVNVITRDPRFAPVWSVSTYGTGHGELTLDLAAAPGTRGLRTLLSGSLARNDRFVDANGDGFADLPLVTRGAVFAKAVVGPPGRSPLEASVHLYGEDRFGGTAAWTRAHAGSDEVYGEYIETRRASLVGAVRPWLERGPRVDLAASLHRQDSWYGTVAFAARQATAFAQATWAPPAPGHHRPLVGASLRFERYDDDTPGTPVPDTRLVPGVFAQHEWAATPALSLLGGLRLDRHEAHGTIASPRLALRWMPASGTTARLNAATGFREVRLFTEDHAALTGARRVVIAEALEPERSWTLSASLQHATGLGAVPLTLDLDAFMTRFTNRIQPDFDSDPDEIRYANLDGHAITRGISAAVSLPAGAFPVSFRIGGTWQEVLTVTEGRREGLPFAPVFKGEYTASWASPGESVVLDLTGRLVGPMTLPRREGVRLRSPWFGEHGAQATLRVVPNGFVIAGVRNLFDRRQQDPILGTDDPFGPGFDTFNVWGPTQGRRLVLGAQLNRPR